MMMSPYYLKGGLRMLTKALLLGLPMAPVSKVFYKYVNGEDLIQVQNSTINLVLSREVRKNARIAAEMATAIALENPEHEVWYVNTYAGVNFLKECFGGDTTSGQPPPPPEVVEPSNLNIFDVPIGMWATGALSMLVREHWELTHARDEPKKIVVIINSYEFAPINRSRRDAMARDLIELRDKLDLTLVIFSHDMRRDVEAGVPGRGPMGMLAARSGSVSRIKDPFENLIRTREPRVAVGQEPRKQAENGEVHEAQMRARPVPAKQPVPAEPERFPGEFRDYHCNPWIGGNKQTGDALEPIAKTPLLKQFFDENKYQFFTRGSTPSEGDLWKLKMANKELRGALDFRVRN